MMSTVTNTQVAVKYRGMSVAYRSTCRPTIGQPLSVDISTDISVECQSTYRPMLERYVGLYIEQHISVDISIDTRPICRPTYRSTLGRYVDRYVGRLSVDMSTDMSVEGCTKYTWSRNSSKQIFPLVFINVTSGTVSESKINIEWNETFSQTLFTCAFSSGKQVSSISARYTEDRTHRTLNIHVAWLSTHGLNCENFDRVKLAILKYLQLQTNTWNIWANFWNGWSMFSVIDSMICEYTDPMNIVCQSCFRLLV